MAAPHASATQSLAAAETGDIILVQRILFEGLRVRCLELGIQEGDVVRCRAGTLSQLILETSRGRTVALQRDWARFIQVAPQQAGSLRSQLS